MNDVFKPAGYPNTNTRASFHDQKIHSYMVPNIWKSLPFSLKATEGLNAYKHKIKKHFLDRMKNNEKDIYSSF